LKKALLFVWALLLIANLFSAQMYVVGEVFTATWCGYCPYARAALRNMADSGEYPYLIPMIWQKGPDSSAPNPPNPSPSYNERIALYGGSSLPHSQWCGTDAIVGGYSGTLTEYRNKYNQKVTAISPIDISLSIAIDDDILHVTANIIREAEMQNLSNPGVFFVLTNNFDATQTPNYFCSVVRYHQQAYDPNTQEYTQEIELNPAWDLENLKVIVIVQNRSGTVTNKLIYNAKMANVFTTPRPKNLISYTGPSVISIKWDQSETTETIIGFNVYRDGMLISNEPVYDFCYTDYTATPGTTHSYQVSTLYESGVESILSVSCQASLLEDNLYQMGSGTDTNPNNGAGPININSRSLRGQFIYTADDLRLVGLTEPTSISSIGFYVQQRPTNAMPQYIFRMRHTDATNLSTNTNGPWETMQFFSTYQPQAGDWRLIELDEPFEWDGERNILIDTAFALTSSSSPTGQVRVITTLASEGYRFTVSNSANQTEVATSTLATYKPQIRFSTQPVSDYDETQKPLTTRLGSNYPNPFNPTTTIYFDLLKPAYATLEIFNVKGQLVKTVAADLFTAGRHFVNWDGLDASGASVSSGIYLYKLQTDDYVNTKKMILLK